MCKINFITNLDARVRSGGGDAVNASTFEQLSDRFQVSYVGPINPSSDYPAKLLSKARRIMRRPGRFHFFSERRLNKIAERVSKGSEGKADCNFFHGTTSWIAYQPSRPYFAYTDACFRTYMAIYQNASQFLDSDLDRLYETEAHWLTEATGVFFRTRWALDEAVEAYSIPRSNLRVAGVGGQIPIPERDAYRGGRNFLFVSKDFRNKGGYICHEAFLNVQSHVPDVTLTVVGEKPPVDVLTTPGVTYAGFLRKSEPEELERLKGLYAEAVALVHPTTRDTNPLVLTEAGYHGCPSITVRRFGIPELVEDGVTGYLIDPPLQPSDFAERMLALFRNPEKYREMRRSVRKHTTQHLTWDAVGTVLEDEIRSSLQDFQR